MRKGERYMQQLLNDPAERAAYEQLDAVQRLRAEGSWRSYVKELEQWQSLERDLDKEVVETIKKREAVWLSPYTRSHPLNIWGERVAFTEEEWAEVTKAYGLDPKSRALL